MSSSETREATWQWSSDSACTRSNNKGASSLYSTKSEWIGMLTVEKWNTLLPLSILQLHVKILLP